MQGNLGAADRKVRYTVGGLLIATGVFFTSNSLLELLLYSAASIAILTALMEYCPLYRLLGVNTRSA